MKEILKKISKDKYINNVAGNLTSKYENLLNCIAK